MPSVHEHFSEQFRKWEMRGRGWQVFEQPIRPEPPFSPFVLRPMTDTPALDDGSRPSFLGSLFRKIAAPANPPQVEAESEEEPEPMPLARNSIVELQTSLPADLDIAKDEFEEFLSNLSLCREPIAFELLGIQNKITAQFAAASIDAPSVRRQLQAYFPEVQFKPGENVLAQTWDTCSGEETLVVEFGLHSGPDGKRGCP
jgi:hypothetical protein